MARLNVERAERRVLLIMAVLTAAGGAVALVCFGWHALAGFVAGAVLSALSFRSLTGVALGIGATDTEGKPLKPATAVFFVFRYLIFGAVGYAIFVISGTAFRAALAGVFVHVAAILIDAIFELFYAGTGTS